MAPRKKTTETTAATTPKSTTRKAAAPKKSTKSPEAKFHLTNQEAENAEFVAVAGTFNNWDKEANKLNKTTDGFELSLPLPKGRYEFKYVLNGEKWITAPTGDKVDNGQGGENSVIEL
ncbi:MAG: isoamylase early set domain-containing protein [Bacteroidales bacterium]|jgi:1,4-alpha-glucan branching enzyme|nr:isoamylase early set domain-containing protein [Bacteroidales bacterium]